jgi:hypothetical protein
LARLNSFAGFAGLVPLCLLYLFEMPLCWRYTGT